MLAGYSRSQIQRLIKDGLVRVEGRAAKANQAVKPGQTIELEMPEPVATSLEAEALP